MSRAISKRSWGPSHQEMEPPFRRGPSLLWKLVGFFALALFVHTIIDPRGDNAIVWCLEAMALGWLAKLLMAALAEGRIPIGWLSQLIAKSESPETLLGEDEDKTAGEAVRAEVARLGGGAYLGSRTRVAVGSSPIPRAR